MESSQNPPLPSHIRLLNTSPTYYLDEKELRIGRVANSLDAQTTAPLQQCPPLSEHQLQAVLPDSFQMPTLVQTSPQPVLQLYSLQHPDPAAMPPLLMARLIFSYDGHRVSFSEKEPRVLVQGSGTPALIIRDEDAEIELLHRNLPEFRMAGVMTDDLGTDMVNALPHSSFLDFTLPSRTDWLDFIAFDLPKLHADGWQIEMDESFDVPVIEIADPGSDPTINA